MVLLCVVAYDIPDNRRRTKLFKLMRGYGRHTQFSVFECHLTHRRLEEMLANISRLMAVGEDDIKVYLLCAGCSGKVITLGTATPPCNPATVVI